MAFDVKAELRVQLAREQGYQVYPAGAREKFALVYPNSYYIGMSNLGIHIIYELLNARKDTACERFFLPEKSMLLQYRKTKTPLLSLETQEPLHRFPLIGIALSFEMDYFHVLEILSLGKVPLRAEKRTNYDPIVIGGGPCATFNPEPLADFFDVFVIGEGEAILPQLLDAYYAAQEERLTRKEILERLAEVKGVYVPHLYVETYAEDGRLLSMNPIGTAPKQVDRQCVKDLDAHPAHTVIITEDTEFNLYLIETARGCGRHCRFCMAGYCFRKPRNRSLDAIMEEVKAALVYKKRIGLMGAAISDYPEINALCKNILGQGLSMSVASFRADSVTQELVEALAESNLQTLTMAPEAGSIRMRAVINKGIEEHHLCNAMELGLAAGIKNFKLYFMIGLPFEALEDIEEMVALTLRMQKRMQEGSPRGTLTLSVNPFIPKPFTPFQWMPMASKAYLEAALKLLKRKLKPYRNVKVIAESIRETQVQGVLARADRRVGRALLHAHENGGAKSFLRSLKEVGLAADFYLERPREEEEKFPWEHLNMGFQKKYLYDELQRAEDMKFTPACFEGCHRCGVC